MAVGIYELAAKYVVKDLEEMLEVMYENAVENGWWHDTYAEQSKEAYFVSAMVFEICWTPIFAVFLLHIQ